MRTCDIKVKKINRSDCAVIEEFAYHSLTLPNKGDILYLKGDRLEVVSVPVTHIRSVSNGGKFSHNEVEYYEIKVA